MTKNEFINCFAHFLTETDLNAAFDLHFKELGHMNYEEVKKWLLETINNEEKYDARLQKKIDRALRNKNIYINKKDLVQRLVEVDEYFNHSTWNMKQIMNNIDLICEYEKEN